ncbi:MAG TPA: MFS transporter [Polyangiaceae bacterium]|nr:MFS transporter [Polyangiaceae bacterium]
MPVQASSLVALRHRNFRLLWFGTFISMGGSMMRNAAILWHVSLLAPAGDKALALGGVGLVRVIPIVACSLFAGVAADAFDRRKLLLVTNSTLLLVSTALAAITLTGVHRLGTVYVLAALSAAVGTFDNPGRNAFFPSLVPREHLPNAISLNSTMFQAASVVGPSVAGLVIARSSVGWVYVIDAVSFLILLGTLLLMRDLPQRPSEGRLPVSLGSVWEGVAFVFGRPLIRSSMLLDFFATFFASATALLPLFAQDVLHVGAHGYGLLASASAAGALLTSVLMIRLIESIRRRGQALVLAAVSYGLVTIGFGLSRWFWVSFVFLFLSGAADMVSTVLRNVIRQLSTPDALRGRMTSVNMIFFMGGPQLGELEAGAVAQAFGPLWSVVSGGIGCVCAVAWIAWQTPALVRYERDPAE